MIENQVNLKKAILQKEVHHTLKKKKKPWIRVWIWIIESVHLKIN